MRPLFVHDMFSQKAKQYPNAIAIDHANGQWTYAQLDRISNDIANALALRGARNQALVVIFTADRRRTIAGILGILKAGCAFVTLTPELPDERAKKLLHQCSPEYAIVDDSLLPRIGKLWSELDHPVCAIPFKDAENVAQGAIEAAGSGPDDLSYIFFTSGSTGTPKPIAGRMKSIDHFVRWEIEALDLQPGTRVSQFTSPMFDAFLRDIFVPLCCGGTVCLPPDQHLLIDGGRMAEWIEEQKIQVIHSVPSIFRALLSSLGPQNRFDSLRFVLLAGEALLPADVKKWHVDGAQKAQLVHLYGPSETTMTKFAYFVPTESHKKRSIPIGRPMNGASAVVVDSQGRISPPGVVGEIYIATPFSTLGYYKLPDLTGAVFLHNSPYGGPEDVVYKTGDLGRILEDGNFEFIGRRDQQVKIRGVRIELAEVEAALRECGGVQQAAVVDLQDSLENKYLCAFLVADTTTDAEAIRANLSTLLPEYMAPSEYVFLDKMPLLSNGKVDRKALQLAPPESRTQQPMGPRNTEEEILCSVFCKVLKRKTVGIKDNFFDLSGHSLLATQVTSRIRSIFGIDAPLRMLFDAPTVEALARQVRKAKETRRRQAPPLVRLDDRGNLPLSFAQQRLWFLHQMEPASAAYNMSFHVRMTGPLDLQAIEESFSKILERHEALRARFSEKAGVPVLQISNDAQAEVQLVDLSSLPREERELKARFEAQTNSKLPFDLTRGPLMRIKLLRMAETNHILSLVMHHIVSDGWSIGVLTREFGQIYQAITTRQTSLLPEMAYQYADFAAWERSWLTGDILQEQLDYWRQQLEDLPFRDLPADRPRLNTTNAQAGKLGVTLDKEATEKIKALSNRESVTVFMALLAALQVVVAEFAGGDGAAIGTVVANRNQTEVEPMAGFFANLLILKSTLHGDHTVRRFLQQVRRTTLDAYDHRYLPFDKLMEELHSTRELSQPSLSQMVFVLQNTEDSGLELPNIQVQAYESFATNSKFDLLLVLKETEGSMQGVFEYRTDLFEATSVSLVKEMLLVAVRLMCDDPDQKLSALRQQLAEIKLQTRKQRESQLEEAWMQKLETSGTRTKSRAV